MKKIENADYRQNEWAVLYVDHEGKPQAMAFDTWEQATKRASEMRANGAPIIGVVTSYFCNAKLADE